VGGKGASSARMAAAGLPVPLEFHVATAAYRRFVTENELQEAHRFAERFGGIRICASGAASLDRHVTSRK